MRVREEKSKEAKKKENAPLAQTARGKETQSSLRHAEKSGRGKPKSTDRSICATECAEKSEATEGSLHSGPQTARASGRDDNSSYVRVNF